MAGLKIRKGDTVQILTGKDRGAKGHVITAFPKSQQLLVEGVNRVRKHTKITTTQRGAQSGGIVTQEAPVHVSNVAVVCPGCNRASRVGHRKDEDGSSVRICRRCGADLRTGRT